MNEAACATERSKTPTNNSCCTKCDAQIKELEDRIEQIRACLIELEHLTRRSS